MTDDLDDLDDITRARLAKLEREMSEGVFKALLDATPQPYTDDTIALLKREFEKFATPERLAGIARSATAEGFAALVAAMDQYLYEFAKAGADPGELRLLARTEVKSP